MGGPPPHAHRTVCVDHLVRLIIRPPSSPPLVPRGMNRCVDHLVRLIIRTIETSIAGAGGDGKISKIEMMRFRRQGGMRTIEASSGRGRDAPGGRGAATPPPGGRAPSNPFAALAKAPPAASSAAPLGVASLGGDVRAGALQWGAKGKAGGGGLLQALAQSGKGVGGASKRASSRASPVPLEADADAPTSPHEPPRSPLGSPPPPTIIAAAPPAALTEQAR